ncbi:MAG: nickel-dependent lactate racemase [Firmicutes bacterium]|nr:nickel-dependent lactate racemase [Bacillota bacterium]
MVRSMQEIIFELSAARITVRLPQTAEVLRMNKAPPLSDPAGAIRDALVHSIGSPGLAEIVRAKLAANPVAKAVVVVSDNTRPVPYRGEDGILWPVLAVLLEEGMRPENITVLVATGTHRPLTEKELRAMLDPRVFKCGIRIKNHDCRDKAALAYLGTTARGSKVYVNREYLAADLKILTGLVESHFMAGVSGGRKAICPGLVGEETTYIFHGAEMLSSPQARDLVLEGNPCHEEALEIARMAGADYIVNVTIDAHRRLTGVFAGDLEEAHARAVAHLKEYALIPVEKEYDVVVTHAGFVGVNHYQAAKAAVCAVPVLKPGGRLILVANHTDPDPVGSPQYRTLIHLLKMAGAEAFTALIQAREWVFIPEQWQVQMWAKVFTKIPMNHLIYFAPQLAAEDYAIIPAEDGNRFLPPNKRYRAKSSLIARVVENAVAEIWQEGMSMACLPDGPYGIPWVEE